jgi:FAD/FMN-containing dehydrogenase
MAISRRHALRSGIGVAALTALGGFIPAAARGADIWDALRNNLKGTLVLPSDSDYSRAKELHFKQFDSIAPQGVAYCSSVEDVRTCVAFAQDNSLPFAVRSGGHSSTGYSTSTGLVADVSRLNSVSAGASTVTVGGGTQQIDILTALTPRGLALPGGSCPTVAVGGFVQGGGFGLLTRSHGMACDGLVSAEVVLADGRVVVASEDSEPDLYWALRGGGGGNFGVVTKFEVRPAEVTRMVNYQLSWAWDDAPALMTAWQDWFAAAPPELGGGSLSIALPDASPGAVPVVSVTGGWTGTAEEAESTLDALVAAVGRAPKSRQTQDLSYHEAMMYWYGCSDKSAEECHREGENPEAMLPRGSYLRARSRMFDRTLPGNAVEEVLAAFDSGRAAGHTRSLSCGALGGKANELSRTETSYVHRDTEYIMIYANVIPSGEPTEEQRDAAEHWTGSVFDTAEPYSNGETYQNYPDPALTDWKHDYFGENYARLSSVKKDYDPHGFFRFPQSIG